MADDQLHLHDRAYPIDEGAVRGKFGTRLGFVLAAVGSAIGLGNVWKFPYIMGENGGSAFLIVYLLCIGLVGLPVLIGEFAIGRRGQTSAVGSFRRIAPGSPWWVTGVLGVLAGFLILSFYSAVAGWVLRYFVVGLTEGFSQSFTNADDSAGYFVGLINGVQIPLVYQFASMVLTAVIIYFGIESGIERASKILMPLLFVIMGLLLIRSLTLDGAFAGVEFMLKPDFSKLHLTGVLEALGHAFFTLSVGMGAMITYASYLGKGANLGRMGISVAGLDTLIALVAGFIIFPAVFAFGQEAGAGPGLIFITLPQIFHEMPGGRLIGTSFFFLVFIAALTSMISLLEVVVTWFVDDLKLRRHVATGLAAGSIFLLGIPSALSASKGGMFDTVLMSFGDKDYLFFDLVDALTSKFMLPIGGMLVCLFIGLQWKRTAATEELAGEGEAGEHWTFQLWFWTTVTIAPLAVLLILFFGAKDFFGL